MGPMLIASDRSAGATPDGVEAFVNFCVAPNTLDRESDCTKGAGSGVSMPPEASRLMRRTRSAVGSGSPAPPA